jgi:hypothetical protein
VLADVVNTALGHKRVARADADGHVVYGTARRIGDENGASTDVDVRSQFLWVTLSTGFEAFWKVSELAWELTNGTFAVDYEPPQGS